MANMTTVDILQGVKEWTTRKLNNNDAKNGYYVCSTDANVAAKTIAATNYVLGNGGSIKVKMTNANTANNATLNINSTGAKALYYASERASANNTWEAGETVEVYYDGTNFYANNVAGGSGDGVLDVSVKYPTSGVEGGNTYTLEGALAVLNANLSANKKKGGMSIKFVLSTDNKYVQYRLMADEFTTDTTQWAIADEGVYVENPEFIYIKTDNEDKILWAIKADGGIYYGAGVPQQVIDYIEEKIDDLSLDEYEDIVAFLDGLEEEDKTLQTLLDEKVDKEEGKSLIDSEYASSQSAIDNPEFLEVTTDSEDKVLEGIKKDGTKVIGADLEVGGNTTIGGDTKILGNIEVSGVSYKVIENPEYLAAWVDAEDKIIFGFKTDGKTYVGDAGFLDDIKNNQKAIEEITNIIGNWPTEYFVGKKVSILGDSISTFNQEGYMIPGYTMYYPTAASDRGADVTTVNDTWWMQVINNFRGVLEVNASYSGSTASSSVIGFSPRVPLLGNPDIIFIVLGTNDSSRSVPVGEINFNTQSYDLTQFAPAYIKGMQDTIAAYPTAKIICVAFDMGVDYQNAIKTIAEHYGAEYIYVGDITDVHPNKAEMAAAANRIIKFVKFTITDAFYSLRGTIDDIGKYVENPELIEAKTDLEGKVLAGRTPDGAAFENVGFSAPKMSIDGYTIENIEDPESRTEILTDSEGRIISYRDSDGVKHEDVGIATNHIELSPNATQDLINALDALGYSANNPSDWSDSEFVELPIPEVCAVVNIEVDSQAVAKGVDIETFIQFWDKGGNYFRKPVLLNAQGSSSMNYHIKNQAIDLNDGSEIKFGNWPAFDSFHIKKYYIDVFRGQCNVGYWLTEQMYQSRPYGERRPWDYLNSFDDVDNANGSFSKDYDTGAMAHPDGFPVHVFFNGNDAGIYAFNIKKARGNYNMKKDKQKQIILDGVLGSTFWTANGDMTISGEVDNNQSLWHDFEIRNPKIDKDIDGNKYDGDNPKEPSDAFATTKAAIARLTTAIPLTLAESTDEAKKAKFAEFFNIPFLLDYELIGQMIFNYDGYRKNWIWCTWDGNLWCPTSYDMDSIFGQHWNGASYVTGSTTQILGTSNDIPTGEALLKSLYQSELRTRYKELRDKGIFSVDNIVGLLEKWVNSCGYDNLKTDIEDIVTSPYTENGVTVVDEEGNPVLIPNTPSYRDGSKTYEYPPATGGWYNSVLRVKNWLVQRIQALDTYYNYNQN